jgi:glycolate oxidase
LLEDEVRRALGLLGATCMAEVSRASLAPAQATNLPSALSAFPLLKIDDFAY